MFELDEVKKHFEELDFKARNDYQSISMNDLDRIDWLIVRAEKAEQYEKALRDEIKIKEDSKKTDKEKWLEYRNLVSTGLGLTPDRSRWVFDKALAGIEKQSDKEKLTEIFKLVEYRPYDDKRIIEEIHSIISGYTL